MWYIKFLQNRLLNKITTRYFRRQRYSCIDDNLSKGWKMARRRRFLLRSTFFKMQNTRFQITWQGSNGFQESFNQFLMMGDPIYDPDNDLWLTRLKDSLNLLNFQIAFGIISSGIKLLVRQMKTAIRWEMGMVGCHFNSHNAAQLLLSHHRFEEVYLCTVRSRSKFK